MINRRLYLCMLGIVALVAIPLRPVCADIVLGDLSNHRFTVSFVGGNQTLTQNEGTPYSFTVQLTEEILSGSDPFLISDPAWGMASGSFNVSVTGASVITSVTGNTAFDTINSTLTPNLAVLSQSGSALNAFGDTISQTLTLGTISGTFVGNGTTTLQLFDDALINELSSIGAKFFNLDPGPGASDTTVLPQLSFAGGTIVLNSISAVPEPGSMALVASILAGSATWRWRRRRAKLGFSK